MNRIAADLVRVERRGPALLVGLNRPARRNALDEALVAAMSEVVTSARAEPCVLVVHSTTPGFFVAGADLEELRSMNQDGAFEAAHARLFDQIEAHRWPTIAVIDGPALGGGCELALACDFRVGSPRARFGQPELGFGLIAGAGANWRLPALVGLGPARRILYGGQIVDGRQSLALGLLDAIGEPAQLLDVALDLASDIAARSWRAIELTKLALRSRSQTTAGFDIAAQALLFDSEDKRTRIDDFMRRPRTAHGEQAPGTLEGMQR